MKNLLTLLLLLSIFSNSKLVAQTTTYLWSNGATTSTINVNPSVTTTYRVTITHGGVPYYDSLVVAVNPNPSTPIITTTAASCSSAGTATITNYDASSTYTFSPVGPIVGAGGSISGATAGTSYSVTVNNTSNCTATSNLFTIPFQLLVPMANAGLDGTITCSAYPSGYSLGTTSEIGVTYAWSPSSGLSATNISNPTANPTVTTTYTLISTNTANGCTASDQVVVNVNKTIPTAAAGGDFTKTCTQNPMGQQIGGTSVLGVTYSWTPSTGLSATNISNPTASPTASSTYTLTATNTTNGCTATDQVIVTVNLSQPIANAGIDGIITCTQNTSGLTLGTTSTSGVSYNWSPSLGLSATNISNPIAFPNSTTTYTLITTNISSGCTASDEVVVTANRSIPSANAGSDFTKSCTFNSNGASIGSTTVSGVAYSWSPSTGLSSTNVSNPIANPTTTTTYTLITTNMSNGCTAADQVIIIVNNSLPNSPTISTTVASCSSAGTATITNYDASSTYTFSPTGPSVGAGGSISGLIAGTSYSVIATNSNACASPISSTFSVAAQLPSNTTSAASSSPTVCSNNSLMNITHSTTGATGIGTATGLPTDVSAAWSGNTITISGTPTVAGTYNYSIPLTGGCGTVNATGTITVTAPSTPTFTQVGPYLSGASIPALPTTSTNGVSGTWSPAISNTTTTTYTFTPSAGQCGTTTTMIITINQPLQYTLTANDSTVCAGTTVTLSVNIGPSYPAGTVHCNGNSTAVVDVTNPNTGKTWMDRNLGASRAAISSTDAQAYGDLYQWGRGADGHQCRNSTTTSTLSSTNTPAHGNFILAPNTPWDWISPQNNNLWQGVNGINNPCPNGYRLPTYAELDAELLSWSSYTSISAFAPTLKLPMAGCRDYSSGLVLYFGTQGSYWSSTGGSVLSDHLGFNSSGAYIVNNNRADGFSVRCLKD